MAKSDEKAAVEEEDRSAAKSDADDADPADDPRDDEDEGDEADDADKADDADDAAPEKGAAGEETEEEEEEAAEDEPLPPPPKPTGVQPVVPPPAAASLGKSVVTFTLVLGGLFALFFLLGNAESPFNNSGPKWRIGQTVSVDLTLDPSDDTKLSCAAKTDIGGKHCEYEDKTTKYAGALKDETQLRPYTTLDGQHLLAAGVWSSPEIEKAKRPTGRFTLKCDFKVEGKINAPAIRWDFAGMWNEKNEEWFAGIVTSCKLQK